MSLRVPSSILALAFVATLPQSAACRERRAAPPPEAHQNRHRSTGTEGLFGNFAGGGQETSPFRTQVRRKRVEKGPKGAPEGPGVGAGKGIESSISVSSLTRWDAIKEVLRKFLAAYVAGDLSGVMQALSSEFSQDSSVLRNAILEDFQRQANINLDLELLSYRVVRNTVQVEVRWNRNAVDQKTGQSAVQTGTSRLLFNRVGGFGLSGWFGATPFGVFDSTWKQQATAGAPGMVEHSSPTVRTAAAQTIEDSRTYPPHPTNFYLDLEAAQTGTFNPDSDGGCYHCSSAGMDLIVSVDSRGPTLYIQEGQYYFGPEAARRVGICDQVGSPLDFFQGVSGTLANFDGQTIHDLRGTGSVTTVVAVERPDGQVALVELQIRDVGEGGPYQVTPRWITGSSLSTVGLGGSSCGVTITD